MRPWGWIGHVSIVVVLMGPTLARAQSTPAPSVTLTTSKSEIAAGRTARLSWTSTNADRCVGTGAWSQIYEGNAAKRGSFTTPALNKRTNTFVLTCAGPGGTTSPRC